MIYEAAKRALAVEGNQSMAVRFTMMSGLFSAKHMKLGGFCPFLRESIFFFIHFMSSDGTQT